MKIFLDSENVMNMSRLVLYILNFNLKKYPTTVTELKYYLFLINEKHQSFFKEPLFNCDYDENDIITDFDYYLFILKSLKCIEFDDFLEYVTALKFIDKEEYSQPERITMDIVLKEYENVPISVLRKVVLLELKLKMINLKNDTNYDIEV